MLGLYAAVFIDELHNTGLKCKRVFNIFDIFSKPESSKIELNSI